MTTPAQIQNGSWPEECPDSNTGFQNFTDEHFSTANLHVTLDSTLSSLAPSSVPQLNSTLSSLVPSSVPQLNSTLSSLVPSSVPQVPSSIGSMQADCEVVKSLLNDGSEAWDNSTDQYTVVFEDDEEVDINGNLGHSDLSIETGYTVTSTQLQGLSSDMVSSSNDLAVKCVPSLGETDLESTLLLDTDIDATVWNFFDELENETVLPVKNSPTKSPVKLEQEALKIKLEQESLQNKSLEINDKAKQKRKYTRKGKMSFNSRTRNLIFDAQQQCKCAPSVMRDEVPEDQVFVRDGQMYRLPDANVVRIGNLEFYAFMKDNDCFISLALFLRDVGFAVARLFEKTIIDYLGEIQIQETGDNEIELLRQKCQVSALTKTRDLISLADIRTLSRVILKYENENDIVKSLANDIIYCKSLSSSALKCSACGYECKAASATVEYEPIEIVYSETVPQSPEEIKSVPQAAALTLSRSETVQETRTVIVPETEQEPVTVFVPETVRETRTVIVPDTEQKPCTIFVPKSVRETSTVSLPLSETLTVPVTSGETIATPQYTVEIVDSLDNMVEEDICLETYHAGNLKVNNYCFTGFKFEDRMFISLKELVRTKLFTVKRLQWTLTKLTCKPVTLPEELEQYFTSNGLLVSNTLWFDVVDVRCCLCLKMKFKENSQSKDLNKSFCAGCYTFTPTSSICCKRFKPETTKLVINDKNLELCASTEGYLSDRSVFAFYISSDECQIPLPMKGGERVEYESDQPKFSAEGFAARQKKDSKVVASVADTTTGMHAVSSCMDELATGEVTAACRSLETIISKDDSMQKAMPSPSTWNKSIQSSCCFTAPRIQTESLDSFETKTDCEKVSDNFNSIAKSGIQPESLVEVDQQNVQTQYSTLESLLKLLRPGTYVIVDRGQLKEQSSESEMILIDQILNHLENETSSAETKPFVQGLVCEFEAKVEPNADEENNGGVTYKLDGTMSDSLDKLKAISTSSDESQMRNNGTKVKNIIDTIGDICGLNDIETTELSVPEKPEKAILGYSKSPEKTGLGDQKMPERAELGDQKRPEIAEVGDSIRPEKADLGDQKRPKKAKLGDPEKPVTAELGDQKRPGKADLGDPKRPEKAKLGDSNRQEKTELGDLKRTEKAELCDSKMQGDSRPQHSVGGDNSNKINCANRSDESLQTVEEGDNSSLPVIIGNSVITKQSQKEDLNEWPLVKHKSIQSPGADHSTTEKLGIGNKSSDRTKKHILCEDSASPAHIVCDVVEDSASKEKRKENTENNDCSVNEHIFKPEPQTDSEFVHSPVSLVSANHSLNTSTSDTDLPTTSTPIISRHLGSPGSHGMASRVDRWYTKIAPLSQADSPDMSLHMLAAIATADAEGNNDTDSEMSDSDRGDGSNHNGSAKGLFQPPVFINLTEEKRRMLLAEKISLEDNIKKFLVFKICKDSPCKFSAVRFKPGAEKVFPELFYPDPNHPQVARKRRHFMVAAARYMEHQMAIQCWELKSKRSSDSSDRKVSDSESSSSTTAQFTDRTNRSSDRKVSDHESSSTTPAQLTLRISKTGSKCPVRVDDSPQNGSSSYIRHSRKSLDQMGSALSGRCSRESRRKSYSLDTCHLKENNQFKKKTGVLRKLNQNVTSGRNVDKTTAGDKSMEHEKRKKISHGKLQNKMISKKQNRQSSRRSAASPRQFTPRSIISPSVVLSDCVKTEHSLPKHRTRSAKRAGSCERTSDMLEEASHGKTRNTSEPENNVIDNTCAINSRIGTTTTCSSTGIKERQGKRKRTFSSVSQSMTKARTHTSDTELADKGADKKRTRVESISTGIVGKGADKKRTRVESISTGIAGKGADKKRTKVEAISTGIVGKGADKKRTKVEAISRGIVDNGPDKKRTRVEAIDTGIVDKGADKKRTRVEDKIALKTLVIKLFRVKVT